MLIVVIHGGGEPRLLPDVVYNQLRVPKPPMSSASPSFADTLRDVADVEGWMTPGQAGRLWECAQRVPPGGTIVEIGSFRGRSMIVLARSAASSVHLVAIDPHAGNDRGPNEIAGFVDEATQDHAVFKTNLEVAQVDDRVRHIRKFSNVAHDDVDGAVDLLYVDGAHRFGPARSDIATWGARVTLGGTMLIHDSFSSVGVTLAILRELLWSRHWRYIGRSESMTEYRRANAPTTKVVVANAARQLRELPWFARNLLIKVLITVKLGRFTRLLGHDPSVWPY